MSFSIFSSSGACDNDNVNKRRPRLIKKCRTKSFGLKPPGTNIEVASHNYNHGFNTFRVRLECASWSSMCRSKCSVCVCVCRCFNVDLHFSGRQYLLFQYISKRCRGHRPTFNRFCIISSPHVESIRLFCTLSCKVIIIFFFSFF